MNTFYRLKGDAALDKSNPLVVKIKDLEDKEYEDGRITVMTDAELVGMIEAYKAEFGVDLPTVTVEL